ncbi:MULTISPECIES: ribonuclease HII [Stenotrophomonas]|uniref:ribonuclease HII n=1 Tax=Stenotrophomonas sp. KCTC 12332 TaxID=1793721 RepID=UPI0007701300|nr:MULTISPECIES: ribonuclease HII [Stenotrophomonas]AMJ55777.1 ribonuclease HII [Stenotrophomonas sp. KCTC 12332]
MKRTRPTPGEPLTEQASLFSTAAVAEPELRLHAGVDEAGRGPLAGPVAVAAVVFDPQRPRLNGLDDSKALTALRREQLYDRIIERALAYKIIMVDVAEIDSLNIFQATMQGMRLAVEGVAHVARFARIDGNKIPKGLPCPAEALVGGDALDRSIMAASILAKVSRDRYMLELHQQHPAYGFDQHKGYGTPLHMAALRAHGPCPQHRRSFAPVRACFEAS